MKYLIIPFAALLFSCSNSNTGSNTNAGTNDPEEESFEIPKKWEKNFSVTLYSGGGMNYESTNIFLFADSCRYVEMENGVDSIKRFVLSQAEKEEVLLKLRSFNVSEIKTIELEGTVYDKETNRICFALAPKQAFCIETGATQGIEEKEKGDFYKAYNYLVSLAKEKGK